MKCILKSLFLLIFILFISQGFSANNDTIIDIRQSDEKKIEVKPGGVFDISLFVFNEGVSPVNVSEKLILPNDWKLIFLPSSFSLNSQSSQLRIFSVYIPNGIPSGEYRIIYEAISETGERKEISVQVIVLPFISINVAKVHYPDYTMAGDNYTISFSITNNGNVPIEINLKKSDNLSYNIQMKDKVLIIPMKETVLSSATITTDGNLPTQTNHRILIEVEENSTQKKEICRYETLIIPKENVLSNRFVVVPCVFSVGTDFNEKDIKFHSKLKLNGFLDSAKCLYLDMQLEAIGLKKLPKFRINSLSYKFNNLRIKYEKYKPPWFSGFDYNTAIESIHLEFNTENFQLHSFISTSTEYYGIYADWTESDKVQYFFALDGIRKDEKRKNVFSIGFENIYKEFYYSGILRFPFLNLKSNGTDIDLSAGYSFNTDFFNANLNLSFVHGNNYENIGNSIEAGIEIDFKENNFSIDWGFEKDEPFDFSLNAENPFITNLKLSWDINSCEESPITLSLNHNLKIVEDSFVSTTTAELNMIKKIDKFTDLKINTTLKNISVKENANNNFLKIKLDLIHNSSNNYTIKCGLSFNLNFETMDKNATTTFVLNKNFNEKGNLSFALDLGFNDNIISPVGKTSLNFSKTVDEELEIEGSFKYQFTENTGKNYALVSFSVNKYFKEMNKLRGKITYNFDENEDFFSGFSFGIEYTHHFDLPILPRTDLATVEGHVYYKDEENKKEFLKLKSI